MKFLGHELGSQTIYKEKGNEITTVINGTFNDELFRTTMDKFIEKYICCQKCKYPEMVLSVKKGIISGRCNACGTRNDLDNGHKLAAFIVKNPPGNKTEIKKGEKAPADAKNGKSKEETKETSEKPADKEKSGDIKEKEKSGDKEKVKKPKKTKENELENEKNEENPEEDSKTQKKEDYSIGSKKLSILHCHLIDFNAFSY